MSNYFLIFMSEETLSSQTSNFDPPDPNFKSRVIESFKKQKFMEVIGAKITKIEPGFCEIQLPYKEDLTQQDGFFHAGIIATMADNAGGYAAFSLMDADANLRSVEYKLNLLAPAAKELLIVRSQVIKSGKTLKICKADIYNKSGSEEKLCATALLTMMGI